MTTSYIRLPPDSTGKSIHTKQKLIDGNLVETQVMHLSDYTNNTLLSIDSEGSASVRFAEGQPTMSGFGILKISEQRALGVYESSTDTYESLFSLTTSNGGSVSYTPVESSELLTTTGSSGSLARMTTNRYHYYLPGSSNLIVMTIATGDSGKANNSRKWGIFDDNDGLYFELDGSTLYAVIRTSTSGAVVETKVASDSWNGEPIDGSGIHEIVLDTTKVNIWWIDYQWLGAGRVRFGIFTQFGDRVVLHEFRNAGSNTHPYMRTGTLPLRVENINTGVAGSGSELRVVCLAIYCEGNIEDYTFWRYNIEDVAVSNVATNTHILSMSSVSSINSKHNSVVAFPETINVYTEHPIALSLYEDTTITGESWITNNNSLQYSIAGSVNTTDSNKMKTVYFDSGCHNYSLSSIFEVNDEGIQLNANGYAKVWSIVASKLTTQTSNVVVSLGVKELW